MNIEQGYDDELADADVDEMGKTNANAAQDDWGDGAQAPADAGQAAAAAEPAKPSSLSQEMQDKIEPIDNDYVNKILKGSG